MSNCKVIEVFFVILIAFLLRLNEQHGKVRHDLIHRLKIYFSINSLHFYFQTGFSIHCRFIGWQKDFFSLFNSEKLKTSFMSYKSRTLFIIGGIFIINRHKHQAWIWTLKYFIYKLMHYFIAVLLIMYSCSSLKN